MIAAITPMISACMILGSFLLTCGALLERKYDRNTSGLIAGGFLLGVLLLQALLRLTGQDLPLILTLLPLTAYLPAIACVHLLSAHGFFQTCAVWTAGLLVTFTLNFWQKLWGLAIASVYGPAYNAIAFLLLLIMAAALLAVVFRVVRTPFRTYVAQSQGGWLPMTLPMLVVFALLSYFSDSTNNPPALALVFLTALVVILTLARTLKFAVISRRNQETEEAIRRQMEFQRLDYEVLNKKLELGRAYRHDLRHHLNALGALLRGGQTAEAMDYIDSLGGQLSETAQERWCENAALNAILAASIGAARQAGCTVTANVRLPAQLPFAELDLCVVLSNAIENAVHACGSLPAPRRNLTIEAVLTDGRRLALSVKNPWDQPMTFDADGFPIVPPREGHGTGLRSIEAVAKKYNGAFYCDWAEGQFTLTAVLFDSAETAPPGGGTRPKRRGTAVLTSVLLCVFFLNCTPPLAQALEALPVVGALVRVVDLRTWSARWGDTSIEIEAPVAEGDGADSVNAQTDAWVAAMEEKFLWHVARKFEGYVSLESFYNTLRDDEDYLVLRFSATVNVGGSVDYARFLTLDKHSGQILTLSDLFAPGGEYVEILSAVVRGQMEEQLEAGMGDYFLPGGIWSEEECFQSIDPEQQFYLDSEGNLVLVFEEYTVAPGSMGMPEFRISLATLGSILA